MESIRSYLPAFLQAYDPLLVISLATGISLLLLVLLIWWLSSSVRKKVAHPGVVVTSFQIAPLGRDAFVKINNIGAPLVILGARITEQTDIIIKNRLVGQEIPTSGNYSILLEAANRERIGKNISLTIHFADQNKNHFEQVIQLATLSTTSLRHKR